MENALCLLSDVCRLCLDLPGIHSIRDTCDLKQDIVDYFGIKISLDDGLPENVCSRCYYRIEAIKDLKDCAINNDNYMKSLLNNSCKSHEVSLPKTSPKIMTDIVGNNTGKVNSYLKLEKTKLSQKGNNIYDSHTQKSDQQRISVKPINELMKTPERMVIRISQVRSLQYSTLVIEEPASKDTIRERTEDRKKEKRKLTSEGHSLTCMKKEKTTSISDDSIGKRDGEFRCDICDKLCSTARKLYHHQRNHTKNLFCPLDVCGKSFSTKGDLQKHLRSHTGEKPYACSLCDKSFTQNVTLKAHMVAVHGGLSFET